MKRWALVDAAIIITICLAPELDDLEDLGGVTNWMLEQAELTLHLTHDYILVIFKMNASTTFNQVFGAMQKHLNGSV